MSDDAELGAAYDNAMSGGSSVIDSGASVAPDTREGPDNWHPAQEEAEHDARMHRLKSEAQVEELGHLFDLATAKLERAEQREMPRLRHFEFPEGASSDDRLRLGMQQTTEAKWEWDQKSKPEQQMEVAGHREIEKMMQAARAFGVKVETVSDLTALLGMMKGDAAAAPHPEFDKFTKTHFPNAKSRNDAMTQLSQVADVYRQWGDHLAADPVRGLRDFAAVRGVHPAQLLTPAEQFELASQLHGVSVRQVLGQLSPEQALDLVPQLRPYLAQQGGDPEQAQATAVMNDFAQSHADFEDLRGDMAAIIKSPAFEDRPGESQMQMLERVYAKARRERSQQAPGKTQMDLELEQMADRMYGSATAA